MNPVAYFAFIALFAVAAACVVPAPALADEGHGHSPVFGAPGKPADVKRTIAIVMKDNSFNHEAITVAAGETIRFVLKNEGEFLHEFNVGSPQSHAGHQKEMMQMMEMGMLTPTGLDPEKMKMDHSGMGPGVMTMKHDDPNSVLVEPGKTKEMIWKFAKATTLEFACNVPGHYQSGMVGHFMFSK